VVPHCITGSLGPVGTAAYLVAGPRPLLETLGRGLSRDRLPLEA
jgi:hypothetical protein